jgi:hypothetical protein
MAATLRARWKLVLSVAVVAVASGAVILALTAFDSSGSETAASDTEQAMLDFAQCMRDNVVPSFPDPVARPDGSFGFERPQGVPDTVLEGALPSCQSELQAIGGGSGPGQDDTDVQDGLLKLSRCMRENGIPEFPDPKPGSDLISGLHGLSSDFDLESPRVARVLERCQAVLNQILSPLHGGGG